MTLFALAGANAGLAAPVSNPNGHVSGQFGDTMFDMPLLCERAPFAIVRTHDGDDAPGLEIALPGGVASIEVRTEAETHQFGSNEELDGFPFSLEGTVNDIDYGLSIDCPAEFAG